MQKKFRVLFTFIFIIFLVGILYFFTNWFSIVTGFFKGEDEISKLALCLRENEAQFYFSEYCADCEKQSAMFGKSLNAIDKIDCGKEKENCPNIREIPA